MKVNPSKEEWWKGYYQAVSDLGLGSATKPTPNHNTSELFKAGYAARMRYQ